MQEIEHSVCGCSYGASSWTTKSEAEYIASALGLRPGLRLLDLGAGAGWPGLYFAEVGGCEVVLVDLPLVGLKVAAQRSARDKLEERCSMVVADAAVLPFAARTFDVLSHSDLLCCLREKRAVLESCKKVIQPEGRMIFTVIATAPGLTGEAYRRAVANGPEFIETECDYPSLLDQTGWRLLERRDITADYTASCRRQLSADRRQEYRLIQLIGAAAYAERTSGWRSKLAALDDSLLQRCLYVARPD